MKLPSKFILKGKLWRIKYKPNLNVDGVPCDGTCSFHNRTIQLEAGLNKAEMKTAFLHELFHVIIHEAHINRGTKFSEGLEEVLSDAFADALQTLFNLRMRRKR